MNRKLTIVLRSLLGLIFVAGPAAAMFHAGEPTLPTEAAAFVGALSKTRYMMPLLWSTEIVAGLMLLSGILVPLALLLLAPVVVNIALFHAVLAPSGAGPAALVIGLEISWRGSIAARSNHSSCCAPILAGRTTRLRLKSKRPDLPFQMQAL